MAKIIGQVVEEQEGTKYSNKVAELIHALLETSGEDLKDAEFRQELMCAVVCALGERVDKREFAIINEGEVEGMSIKLSQYEPSPLALLQRVFKGLGFITAAEAKTIGIDVLVIDKNTGKEVGELCVIGEGIKIKSDPQGKINSALEYISKRADLIREEHAKQAGV